MFCSNCGSSLDDNCKFCTNCGAPVKQPETEGYQSYVYQPVNHTSDHSTQSEPPVYSPTYAEAPRTITFGEAIGAFFRKADLNTEKFLR